MAKAKQMVADDKGRVRWKTNAVICALVAVLLVIPVLKPKVDVGLEKAELRLGDILTNYRTDIEPPMDFALIGVDDVSLNILDVMDEAEIAESEHLEAMTFGWPFPRSTHAALIERLVGAGARLVVLDMLFPNAGEGDERLKDVLNKHKDKVVIAGDIVSDPLHGYGDRVNLPSDTVLELSDSRDPRLGMATFDPDPADSTIRSARGLYQLRDNPNSPVYNSMAYAALMQLGKESVFPDPLNSQHFRCSQLLDVRLRKERGLMRNSFEALPYYTIFSPREWEKNYQSGAFFKDKIVYVGGTSIGRFHDEALVPNGNVLGVQLQMGVLAAALQGEFYHAPTGLDRLLMTFFMALLAFLATFIFKRPMIGLLVLVGALFLFLKVIVPQCYEQMDVLLPSFGPALAFAVSGLFCFGSQYAAEILEKARLRRTLERQMSKELAEHILSQPENYYESLPGVRKPVTILFSDIRSFTTRSERDDPVDLVSQLQEYLDAMGKVVFKNGGMVDKFIGDAVMAVWGNIRSDGPEKDSSNAVAAAVEMMSTLRELNSRWEKRGWAPFEIGIGLNHGDAIFGMMGSKRKQEMTVIGDPVNQAARLEGLTKKFGEEIVVGTQVAEFVRGQFPLREIGAIRTKGKDEAARLYAVSCTEIDAGWLEQYHAGLEFFQKGFLEEAAAKLTNCLEKKPGDRLCAMYLEAIKDGDGGDGVLTMKEK